MFEIRYPRQTNTYSEDSILAFGSEQCSVCFLKQTQSIVTSSDVITSEHGITIVTPKVDEFHFAAVVDRIDKIRKLYNIVSIVVNDWGILQHFCETNNHIDLTIGRVLLGSFGYRDSFSDLLLHEEDPLIARNALAPSALHLQKIELFREYGATAVEVCHSPFESDYANSLKKYGLAIHLHINTMLVALSKVCYKSSAINDNQLCNMECSSQPERLQLVHIDGYNPLSKHSLNESEYHELCDSFPQFYLTGNAVYRKTPFFQNEWCHYDRLIIDERFS